MSKKIATFKDLDTLASLGTGTSAGYISGAENEQCVTKGNFDIVSTETIAAKGNGLMFVDGSESSKYESNRLILLDDVQYISEITAVLVSAPNIPAKGGSSYATWKLSQSYKVNGDASPSVIEWQVTGSVVEASSKGTDISAVTNVANSTATVTKNGKSISLSQMIKQDLNKIVSNGNWTTPTVTVNPTSFAAAGGTATITISGDSTRENTWSSGSKTIDTASISSASATLGTVSNDYKKLTIGVNTTGLNRTGNVCIDWSFESDDKVVKSVESNSYSQDAQTSSTLTLTGVEKIYDGDTYYVSATASVAGTIYYGTSSGAKTYSAYVNTNGGTVNLTSLGRKDAGTTKVYAYLDPDSDNYSNSTSVNKTVKINKAEPSLTLTGSIETYDGITAATVTGKASVAGTIYYGTTSSSKDMSSYQSVEADKTYTLISRTTAGTTTVYAYFIPNDTTNYESLGSSTASYTSASAKLKQASDASITITTSDTTYNGTAQTVVKCDETHGVTKWQLGYATSESATLTNGVTWIDEKKDLSLTNAGTYYIWRKWTADENHSNTNSGTKIDATVTIYKKPVIVIADSETQTYNGKSLSKSTFTYTALVTGHVITCSVAGSITDVGSVYNVPSGAKIYTNSDKTTEVTSNYNISYVKGSLSVTARPVTYKADNQSKTYDGSALSASNTATETAGDGLVSGHTATFTCTGSITDKGSTTKTLSSVTIKSGSTDVTSNYSITKNNGLLTISARGTTVTAGSKSKTYDGSALSYYNATASHLASGHTLSSYTCSGSITNFGSTNNVPSAAKITNSSGTDVTSNYTIYYENGTLTINKRSTTVTAGSTSKTYDGTALSYYNALASNLVSGHTLDSYTCTGSVTNATSVYNVPSNAVIKSGSTDVTDNYSITYKNGTLTITQRSVTFTATSQNKIYDGTALSVANTATPTTGGDLVSGHTATFTCSATAVTNVSDSSTKSITGVTIKNGSGTDVTNNYSITKKTGSLSITARPVTFKADYESKVYTGSVLSASNTASLTSDGLSLMRGHEATFTCSGSRINVGKTTKSITGVTIKNDSGTDVTSNYNITKQSGEFEVIQREVKITSPAATQCTYNGSDQTIFVAGTCTTGGTMYYSDTNKTFSTSTWSKSLPYTQKTNAGTYTLYYYCYVSDTTNNTGTGINTIKSIIAIIDKAPATITFAGRNVNVQCENSDTSLMSTREVSYVAAIAKGSISYTITSIKNPSGVNGTYITMSPITTRALRLALDTPVGDYSVDITASQSDPNYTSTPVTRTYKISVLPDTLSDYTGTLSISNASVNLSAGVDMKTIIWGAIHQVWEHGGGKVYMPNNANLTVSCNNSTAKTYVSIDKNSYVNSSDTTTSILTKKTYGTYEHTTGAIFTLQLRAYNGDIIQTLNIYANSNDKIHTLTGVSLSYKNPASSSSGTKQSPSVSYSTSYKYRSGASGSTTTGNVATNLNPGTTFTKSFSIVTNNTAASLDTSTGVVTWNSANTSTSTRSIVVKCTGTLTSYGSTSSVTSNNYGAVQAVSGSLPTSQLSIQFVNSNCPINCQYRIVHSGTTLYTVTNSTSQGSLGSKTMSNASVTFTVYGSNSSSTARTLYVSFSGGGGTASFSPSQSITVPANTATNSTGHYISVTLSRTATSGSWGGAITVQMN
jgi:hypothetical protein